MFLRARATNGLTGLSENMIKMGIRHHGEMKVYRGKNPTTIAKRVFGERAHPWNDAIVMSWDKRSRAYRSETGVPVIAKIVFIEDENGRVRYL